MKTYLILYFSGNGKPTDIAKRLEGIGFKVSVGKYDFIYNWKTEPAADEILALGDKVTDALRDKGIVFKLESE